MGTHQEPELPQDVVQTVVAMLVPGGRSTAIRRLPGSFSNESHCIEGVSAGASRASDDAVRDRLERFIEEALSRAHRLP